MDNAFQETLQHIHFMRYLPFWPPRGEELHPLHLHDVFRSKPSAWHMDAREWRTYWNWMALAWNGGGRPQITQIQEPSSVLRIEQVANKYKILLPLSTPAPHKK